MAEAPAWIKQHRSSWQYTGANRPPFAKEPQQGQESVWDYPRPPRVEPLTQVVSIQCGEITLCESNKAVRVLETASPPTIYIPKEEIRMDYLEPTDGGSLCEWKGQASYWNVVTPEKRLNKVAWSYEDPFPEFETITGYLAFYPKDLDCRIDNEQVLPQPGGLYGGWVTKNLAGPLKGEPGTGGW